MVFFGRALVRKTRRSRSAACDPLARFDACGGWRWWSQEKRLPSAKLCQIRPVCMVKGDPRTSWTQFRGFLPHSPQPTPTPSHPSSPSHSLQLGRVEGSFQSQLRSPAWPGFEWSGRSGSGVAPPPPLRSMLSFFVGHSATKEMSPARPPSNPSPPLPETGIDWPAQIPAGIRKEWVCVSSWPVWAQAATSFRLILITARLQQWHGPIKALRVSRGIRVNHQIRAEWQGDGVQHLPVGCAGAHDLRVIHAELLADRSG